MKITFFNTMLYKDKIATSKQLFIANLQMNTLNEAFLHAKPEHPRPRKEKFLDRHYKEEVLDEQINEVDGIKRK